MARSIQEVVEQLKRDPSQPVRTQVGDLTIELRALADASAGRTAAAVFAELGPWEGESTEELFAILARARHRGGSVSR